MRRNDMHRVFAANAVGQSAPVSVDHYENFPVASWLCPARMRGAVRAIYHFARCADDLADEGDASQETRIQALADYREALEHCLEANAQTASGGRWASIFADLKRAKLEHHLPAQPLRDLLSAFEQDVRNPAYADRRALLDYCARSANPIGRLLLHLYDVSDAISLRRSDAVCSALQLINFWQDLSVDVPRGRLYVPQSDLTLHKLRAEDLRVADSKQTRALVTDLVVWARGLMLEGAPLAHRVPGRAGWELRLVVQGGLRILDRIEAHGFQVLRWRPSLGASDYMPMAWGALRMSVNAAPTTRHDPA